MFLGLSHRVFLSSLVLSGRLALSLYPQLSFRFLLIIQLVKNLGCYWWDNVAGLDLSCSCFSFISFVEW